MKRDFWIAFMVLWTLCCPLLYLSSNTAVSTFSISNLHQSTPRFKPFKVFRIGQEQESPFSQNSIVESLSEADLFSVVQRYFSSPHFFFMLVYGGLLIQFFFFFKRRLPFCYYLAPRAQEQYLVQRVLLI